jgi:hypothetical protein
VLDADNAVWLGDLNYRISLGDEEVRRLIRAGRLEQLADHDQLYNEMQVEGWPGWGGGARWGAMRGRLAGWLWLAGGGRAGGKGRVVVQDGASCW